MPLRLEIRADIASATCTCTQDVVEILIILSDDRRCIEEAHFRG